MKYTTAALVIVALLGVTNAIHLKTDHKAKAKFSDDLVKSLAEDMDKDINAAEEKPAEGTPRLTKEVTRKAASASAKTGKCCHAVPVGHGDAYRCVMILRTGS